MHDLDREAFDDFVRARLPELLRFGRALTGSPHAAADLVQDALERTMLAWPRLESRADPEGYVRRVMVNRNISIWRKLRHELLTDEVRDEGHPDRHPGDDLNGSRGAEGGAERGAERSAELWAALQRLPPRQRAVIALRYYEDRSEAEIASILGCAPGTVKSQASKALATLRRLVPTQAQG